jgi:stage V sporulation protein G
VNITEVKVFLRTREEGKLRAYATITIDNAFVIRDLKVIEGNKGLFVAMPSRKLRQSCPHCGHRNVVRSKYCNQCGNNIESLMREGLHVSGGEQGDNQHRDIAHPITAESRQNIQSKILEAYQQRKGATQSPSPEQQPPQPPPSSPSAANPSYI